MLADLLVVEITVLSTLGIHMYCTLYIIINLNHPLPNTNKRNLKEELYVHSDASADVADDYTTTTTTTTGLLHSIL